ncbi:MAG: insulinase family protein [Candidatus Marsarchaeota archaeon]|jgi:predicted Zn-dependent peptidase|nr:insulinase family protein [Candidatus Marsarchaeota archaeon]
MSGSIREITLDNGLDVIVNPDTRFKSVGIAVGVRYGSIDEPKGKNGSAHYTEHMLFKGTKRRTYRDIWDESNHYGMYINAFTQKENTIYYTTSHRLYFDNALDLLSDMIKNSEFPEKEFEKERGPIINENMMGSDNPIMMMYDNFPTVLYKRHPARLSISGDTDVINSIGIEDVRSIYDTYYNPKNMVVAISGGIGGDYAIRKIKEMFGDLDRPKRIPKRELARESQVHTERRIRKVGIRQTRIALGFKCSPYELSGRREYLALDLLSTILSKTLFHVVRGDAGFSYDPKAYLFMNQTFAFIAAMCGIDPRNEKKVKGILIKEFDRLYAGEISKEEFGMYKKGLSVSTDMGFEYPTSTASYMATAKLTFGEMYDPKDLRNEMNSVTLDDVRGVASKYIKPGKYSYMVINPANKDR